MIEIRLPQFGMGMTDGTIIAWHRREGEWIVKGEPLCDIEAAKTTVEFEAPESGVLARILVKSDENVPCDTVIAELNPTSAHARADAPEVSAQAEAMREEADVPREAVVAASAKVTPLARRSAENNGVDLASVTGTGSRGRIRRCDIPEAAGPPDEAQVEPRARRAAREHGIGLDQVTGSGPNGRITEEDVICAATSSPTPPPPEHAAADGGAVPPATETPAPASEQSGERAPGYSDVTHSMTRRTIARRLTESKQTVPHFYVKANCRIDRLLALRSEINAGDHEKVSVNDLVVRAVGLALI